MDTSRTVCGEDKEIDRFFDISRSGISQPYRNALVDRNRSGLCVFLSAAARGNIAPALLPLFCRNRIDDFRRRASLVFGIRVRKILYIRCRHTSRPCSGGSGSLSIRPPPFLYRGPSESPRFWVGARELGEPCCKSRLSRVGLCLSHTRRGNCSRGGTR